MRRTRVSKLRGVEESCAEEAEMMDHLEKDHLSEYLQGKPILSKIGMITKVRNGVTKIRTILDTKESGVTWITSKTQRVILPRLMDAVLRMLFLLSVLNSPGETVGSFVLDFSDAFWQIPIAVNEHKYLYASIIAGRRHKRKRKYLAFKRAAQGSSNAPLLWARTAALLMRECQAFSCTTQVN